MRILMIKEVKKRGCKYCTDSKKVKSKGRLYGQSSLKCKHEKCPYNVLDKFKNYNDYIKFKENECRAAQK